MDHVQLSLSELQSLVKGAIEDVFSESVWVTAEISEISVNRSGHCYLELVETVAGSGEITARIRATIWSYTFRMLKPYFETTTGQSLTEGIKVLINAKPEYHEVYGLSLNIRDIDPTYTMGDLARQRREIILRLEKEGVVDMNKELELPLVPQKIAVISSPNAAGLQDFMDQVHNNQHGIVFYTKLFSATMQGKDAPLSIISALEQVYEYEHLFDIVVIIRGGGAQLDLACFDNFDLAFHVAQFPLPVITGIGHDKDDSVTDLVAHTRLKTPTAVAEFLVSGAKSFLDELDDAESKLITLVSGQLDEKSDELSEMIRGFDHLVRHRIQEENNQLKISGIQFSNLLISSFKSSRYRLEQMATRSDNSVKNFNSMKRYSFSKMEDRLFYTVQKGLNGEKDRIQVIANLIQGKVRDGVKNEWKRLEMETEKLRLIDPENVIKRGYSLTLKDGEIVTSVTQLNHDEVIETRMKDGKIKSKVIKK